MNNAMANNNIINCFRRVDYLLWRAVMLLVILVVVSCSGSEGDETRTVAIDAEVVVAFDAFGEGLDQSVEMVWNATGDECIETDVVIEVFSEGEHVLTEVFGDRLAMPGAPRPVWSLDLLPPKTPDGERVRLDEATARFEDPVTVECPVPVEMRSETYSLYALSTAPQELTSTFCNVPRDALIVGGDIVRDHRGGLVVAGLGQVPPNGRDALVSVDEEGCSVVQEDLTSGNGAVWSGFGLRDGSPTDYWVGTSRDLTGATVEHQVFITRDEEFIHRMTLTTVEPAGVVRFTASDEILAELPTLDDMPSD